MLKIIFDRFFKQIERLFYLRKFANTAFCFKYGDEFLAVGDFVFEHIIGIFGGKLGFQGFVDLIDGFSQFPGTILQNFSRRFLIVASFCMRRIDNDGFAFDNVLSQSQFLRFC